MYNNDVCFAGVRFHRWHWGHRIWKRRSHRRAGRCPEALLTRLQMSWWDRADEQHGGPWGWVNYSPWGNTLKPSKPYKSVTSPAWTWNAILGLQQAVNIPGVLSRRSFHTSERSLKGALLNVTYGHMYACTNTGMHSVTHINTYRQTHTCRHTYMLKCRRNIEPD